jgi:hypothetical protein
LQQALQPLQTRGLVELHRLETPTLGALQRTLRQQEYHVFHFIGHGSFDADSDQGLLIVRGNEGQNRTVSGQEMAMMLCDEKSLRLAILNACEGGRTSVQTPFAGVAQNLVQQGIPAVLAMQFEISDAATITLSSEFYAALADRYPVDAALRPRRAKPSSPATKEPNGAPLSSICGRRMAGFSILSARPRSPLSLRFKICRQSPPSICSQPKADARG